MSQQHLRSRGADCAEVKKKMQIYFILPYPFDAPNLSYAIKNSVPSSREKKCVAITETTCVLLERFKNFDYHNNRWNTCVVHTLNKQHVELVGVLPHKRFVVFVE
jgi:hypothetical protein